MLPLQSLEALEEELSWEYQMSTFLILKFSNEVLPNMTSLCVMESLAIEFSAVHVYSPASCLITSLI